MEHAHMERTRLAYQKQYVEYNEKYTGELSTEVQIDGTHCDGLQREFSTYSITCNFGSIGSITTGM